MQIFKYYAYFLLLLHRFLHFYCNMPVFAIITWKRADDDDKNENPLCRGAAHTFPPPRLAFFYFPNIPPPPLGLFFASAPFAVFFDFILNFCYNIYIKQGKIVLRRRVILHQGFPQNGRNRHDTLFVVFAVDDDKVLVYVLLLDAAQFPTPNTSFKQCSQHRRVPDLQKITAFA